MNEATDFVSAMHDDLGEHYQLLMMKHKGNISPDTALHAAAILTAAQSNAIYTSQLQGTVATLHDEVTTLRKAMIAIEKARQQKG